MSWRGSEIKSPQNTLFIFASDNGGPSQGRATGNARQVPKLPDYAVVDLNEPISEKAPGKIVDAGFFNESWKIETK